MADMAILDRLIERYKGKLEALEELRGLIVTSPAVRAIVTPEDVADLVENTPSASEAEQNRCAAERHAGKVIDPNRGVMVGGNGDDDTATPPRRADKRHIGIRQRRLDIAGVIAKDGPQKTIDIARILDCGNGTISAALNDGDWFERGEGWLYHLTPVGLAAWRESQGIVDPE